MKEHRDSTRRIDLAVAVVMVYAAAASVETGCRSLCSIEIVARPELRQRPGFICFAARHPEPRLGHPEEPVVLTLVLARRIQGW